MLLQHTVCDNVALTFHSVLFHFYGMILLFYSALCMIRLMMMREILEQITTGSPMVGTSINLVQRPINLPNLKTFEMVKEQERKEEMPGVDPGPLAYHASAMPLRYSSHQQPQARASYTGAGLRGGCCWEL